MYRSVVATLLLAPAIAAAQTAAPPPAPALDPARIALEREVEEILAVPGWAGVSYGVMVASLDRGDTLFARAPGAPLAPASNLKLYSTAAALYYLGADFRYETYLLADGPLAAGVLEGDVVLYGTGDPGLSRRMLDDGPGVLAAFADSLVAAGVREVRGAVVGDGSWFDARWRGAAWEEDDLLSWYAAPVGALNHAENLVTLRVLPAGAGAAARVATAPETGSLPLVNEVRTVRRGADRVMVELNGREIRLTGTVRAGGRGVTRTVPVADPTRYAAEVLAAELRRRGVVVRGGVRAVYEAESSSAGRREARVVAIHRSPPLAEYLRVTNHVSHNLFADALLKTVGRVARGEGSFEAGEAAVRAFLAAETPLDPTLLEVEDGSGLSRTNRVTARGTLQLLDYMLRSTGGAAFLASLPAAGDPRGLRRRMAGTAAAANLRAKTGTIRGVSALSGYVTSADGERLVFSILVNGAPSTARAKRLEDAIGARLAAFRRGQAAPLGTPARP